MEAQAREMLDMPPVWGIYRWEVKGAGVLVEGAVPLGTIKTGPRKGQPKWWPREKEAAIVILNKQRIAWLAEWDGWHYINGNSYRPCTRCDATGIAQPSKAIAP